MIWNLWKYQQYWLAVEIVPGTKPHEKHTLLVGELLQCVPGTIAPADALLITSECSTTFFKTSESSGIPHTICSAACLRRTTAAQGRSGHSFSDCSHLLPGEVVHSTSVCRLGTIIWTQSGRAPHVACLLRPSTVLRTGMTAHSPTFFLWPLLGFLPACEVHTFLPVPGQANSGPTPFPAPLKL